MSIVGSIIQASSGGAGGTSFTDVSTAVDYTVTGTKSERIYVDTTSAAVNITLPAGASNQVIEVIDAGKHAGANIITIVGTIDGVSNSTIEADDGAKTIAYSGTAWETSGGFQNYFKRNAETSEISIQAPDTLLANAVTSGNAGATSDQSVTDADFANIGANVDQTVADEFGNDSEFVGTTNECTGGTAYASSATNKPATRAFDGLFAEANRWQDASGLPVDLSYSFPAPEAINKYRIYAFKTASTGTNNQAPSAWEVRGTNDGRVTHDVLSSETAQSLPINAWSSYYDFINTTAYNEVYLHITAKEDPNIYTSITELEFVAAVETYDTTLNTFDTNLATVASGTFSAGTFKAYDNVAALISGTGKVNVAYEVDGGGMGALVDQDTFKALGDIAYTTQFDIQLQLVGAQRFSKATISTPNTVLQLTSDGQAQVMDGGSKVSSFGKLGVAPVSLTTTERDALTGMDGGAIIFNETTGKLNVYNGSAWEVITSS